MTALSAPARARPAPRRTSLVTVHHHEARAGERQGVRLLASYRGLSGHRDVIAFTRSDGCALVLDRAAGCDEDARVVGILAHDEPAGNAQLLCAHYLADPTRGRCRAMTPDDLLPAERLEPAVDGALDGPLVDRRGRVYLIAPTPGVAGVAELRWTCSLAPGCGSGALPLREVVGALEAYEPARSVTVRALAAASGEPFVYVARLRGELERLDRSPIVLNRGLREAVERELAAGASLSAIAMRCGRHKRDRRGNPSGETSWLSRRIGLLPEGGGTEPTPWVHSDTLALIAREGLAVSPREVEL